MLTVHQQQDHHLAWTSSSLHQLPTLSANHRSSLQGMQRLNSRHGCGFVHLRLHFKRGLHPFYPPTAQLLWPRCQGPFAGALSSHPMIQLQSWDPWKPVKELICQLRVFTEVHALENDAGPLCSECQRHLHSDDSVTVLSHQTDLGLRPHEHSQTESQVRPEHPCQLQTLPQHINKPRGNAHPMQVCSAA